MPKLHWLGPPLNATRLYLYILYLFIFPLQSCKGDTGQKYRSAIRSRVFNLRDVKNPELGDDVIHGAILAEDFAKMTSEEMASKDMKRLREDLRLEANRTERVLHSPRNLFLTRW